MDKISTSPQATLAQTSPALLVFARIPQHGAVKQRLAEQLGATVALRTYKALLAETAALVAPLTLPVYVYWAGEKLPREHSFGKQTTHRLQPNGELGARMQKAFGEVFREGHTPVLIIGSDCPFLQPTHIHDALEALRNKPYVLGPCTDGGYYLLGMRRMSNLPFTQIPWSTEQVLALTLKRLGLSNCHLLPVLRDIDRPADLAYWRSVSPNTPHDESD